MNINQLRTRAQELNAEVAAKIIACERGDLSLKAFEDYMVAASAEDAEIASGIKAYNQALQYNGSAGASLDSDGAPAPGAGGSLITTSSKDNGKRLTFGRTAATLAAKMLGAPDGLRTKALAPSGSAVADQDFKPDPIALGKPAHSLLDVLPVQTHETAEFSYLRQTVRTNNAAVVPDYGLKPTSVYSVEKIEDRLDIVAHLSEPVPRHWFIDNGALQNFISNELDYGLRLAVEAKVLADVNATSGIQVQAYATSALVTIRKSITRLETAGYTPGFTLLDPADWEAIELLLTTSGATDVQGIPYDPAQRRLFGVPVVVSVAQAAGVGHTVAKGAVALDTGTEGTGVQWSENASDDFQKNLMRARSEGRYATSVYAPLGVVTLDLTA